MKVGNWWFFGSPGKYLKFILLVFQYSEGSVNCSDEETLDMKIPPIAVKCMSFGPENKSRGQTWGLTPLIF